MFNFKTTLLRGIAIASILAIGVTEVIANHPVLVEGNNATNAGPGATATSGGTGGDYDGDGLVGTAEDTDNAVDRVFGTLTAALLGVNGGANANGHVTIVTSGRFPEAVRIPNTGGGQAALGGVTVLEAAPGVQAVIDAVLAGDAGNATRVANPGIIVETDQTDRVVILRNLTIRNFSVGLLVRGKARVICDNCRFDSNIEANVRVIDDARITMTNCSVTAGGMRFGTGGGAPNPGDGIVFEGNATGSISGCTIAANSNVGVRNNGNGAVSVTNSHVSDNKDDFSGRVRRR